MKFTSRYFHVKKNLESSNDYLDFSQKIMLVKMKSIIILSYVIGVYVLNIMTSSVLLSQKFAYFRRSANHLFRMKLYGNNGDTSDLQNKYYRLMASGGWCHPPIRKKS